MSGVTEGLLAGQRYRMNEDTHDQDMAMGGLKIEQEDLENQKSQLMLQQQKSMSEQMAAMGSGVKAGQPDPGAAADHMAGNMETLANFAMNAGMPEKAKEYMNTASNIRNNQSKIEARQDKIKTDRLNLISKLSDGVHDQQSWEQAQALFETETGQKSELADQPYSPQLIQRLQQATQTATQKAIADRNRAQARASDAQANLAPDRARLLKAQTVAAEARAAKLSKVGGDAIAPPKAGTINGITDMIASDYETDSDIKPQIKTLSRPIAERVDAIMKNNPHIEQSDAMKQAYNEAKVRGDFGGLSPIKKLPGESEKAPMPMPATKDKLQDNKWYNIKGTPMLLMGGKFYKKDELKGPPPATGDTSDDTPDDGDDEEDDQ